MNKTLKFTKDLLREYSVVYILYDTGYGTVIFPAFYEYNQEFYGYNYRSDLGHCTVNYLIVYEYSKILGWRRKLVV